MQRPSQESSPRFELNLREHLLAVAQAGTQQPNVPQTSPHDNLRPLHVATAQEAHIDPAIGAPPYPLSGGESVGDDPLGDPRKGRRELSTSKRAAQNRAAQRAFRQRKEEYIKKLKAELEEYKELADQYQAVQQENYQLRDYIINLQSRLLESQGEYPQPPANINLQHPGSTDGVPHPGAAPTASMASSAVSQLQAAAVQAAAEANEIGVGVAHAASGVGQGSNGGGGVSGNGAAASAAANKHGNEDGMFGAGAEYPSKRQKSDDPLAVGAMQTSPSIQAA